VVKILRSLSPNALIVNALVLVLLRVIPIINPQAMHNINTDAPLSKFLFEQLGIMDWPYVLNIALASIILFIQSLIFNKIMVEFGLFERSTYIPQFIFIFFYSLLPEFWVVSPMLLCNFILLLAFSRIFSLQKKQNSNAIAFDLGLIFSLASLFYLPFLCVSVIVWYSFYLLRPFNWREWTLALLGLTVPYYFYWTYLSFNSIDIDFLEIIFPLLRFNSGFPALSWEYSLAFIPFIIFFAISIWQFRKDVFKNTIFIRKIFQLILYTFVLVCIGFFIPSYKNASHFILLGIPCSVFAGYYFMIVGLLVVLVSQTLW
jgi:hypothetical protein